MSAVRQITARYPGTCADCGAPIAAGATINYGGRGAVTHEGCAELEGSSSRARTRRRSSSRYRAPYRCTHEDYPCCGCGPDAGR